jgi:HEAT repeat protein
VIDWEASENDYALPPPDLPGDDEEGLLAELSGEDGARWFRDQDARHAAPETTERVDPAGSIEGSAAVAAEGASIGRDPIVDTLKAGLDLSDTGQVLAFLMATFTADGTKLGPEDLETLFAALEQQEDFGLRNLLFAHLERIGGDDVTDGVLAFLGSSKDAAAMKRALSVLRKQGDDNAVTGLVSFLAETKNAQLKEVALKNLLLTGNGSATDPLLRVLGSTTDRRTKQFALAAISQLGGAQGAETVLQYAASSDGFERGIGWKSLKDIRSKEAVPVLAESLSRSSDPRLRTQVLRTLGQIKDDRAVGSISQVALYEGNRSVRMEAIKSLAIIGSADAIPALRTIQETEQNAAIRRSASRTISYLEKVEARRAAQPRR